MIKTHEHAHMQLRQTHASNKTNKTYICKTFAPVIFKTTLSGILFTVSEPINKFPPSIHNHLLNTIEAGKLHQLPQIFFITNAKNPEQ